MSVPVSPAPSSTTISGSRVVPLTELAETSQIILSDKPRLINVTHQIPYACTLIDRASDHNASIGGSGLGVNGAGGVGSTSGSGSPPANRRSSYISVRQQHQAAAAAAKSQASAGAGAATTGTDPLTGEPVAGAAAPGATPAGAGAHEDGDCKLEGRRGHSALYSGIMSLRKDLETIQIGWVGELADQDGYIVPSKSLNESHKQAMREKLWTKDKVVPIFLDDSRAAGHYEGYCKSGKPLFFSFRLFDS